MSPLFNILAASTEVSVSILLIFTAILASMITIGETLLSTRVHSALNTTGDWFGQHGVVILLVLISGYLFRKIGTRLILRVVEKTVRKDLFPTETDRKKRVKTLESLVGGVLRIGTWLIVFTIIIDELGVDTGPLIASAGVLGVALGFGAQSLIKDFVSGVFIIIENQYRVGDIVELNEVDGTVEAITIRTTVLRDLDGHLHHIPNGSIVVSTNKTMDFGRINEDILVGKDTDIDNLENVINKVGQEMANSSDLKNKIIEPPHFASLKGFSKNGMLIKVLAKTRVSDNWEIKTELYRRLKKAFDAHDIELPYEHLVIDSLDDKKLSKKSR